MSGDIGFIECPECVEGEDEVYVMFPAGSLKRISVDTTIVRRNSALRLHNPQYQPQPPVVVEVECSKHIQQFTGYGLEIDGESELKYQPIGNHPRVWVETRSEVLMLTEWNA